MYLTAGVNTRIWRCKFWRYQVLTRHVMAVMFWCVANWAEVPEASIESLDQLSDLLSVSLVILDNSFERCKFFAEIVKGCVITKKKLSGISMIAQSAVLNLVTLVTLVLHQLLHTHICSMNQDPPSVLQIVTVLQPRAALNHQKGRKLVGLPVCWVKNCKCPTVAKDQDPWICSNGSKLSTKMGRSIPWMHHFFQTLELKPWSFYRDTWIQAWQKTVFVLRLRRWIRCLKKILMHGMELPSLKLTAKAPGNGWLEDFLVSFWDGLFSGANC